MQNRAKRILALLMMVCLLVGLLPVGALATQSTSGAEFVAQQLSLGDDLDMRYYVAIDESLAQSAVMNITVAGNTKEYPISEETPNEDGNYVFTVALAAAQMTDDITLSLVDGEDEIISKTYSVQGYAKVLLEGNYDEATKAMVKEMLNYGAKAQAYFNYNTGNYANAGYEIEASAAVPSESLAVTKEGSVSGISFYGASLVYTSKVAVRFYFTADSTEGISFKVGETSYNPIAKDGMHYVEIPGINPQDYDEIVSIVVSNGTDSMTIGYSPLHYIIRMYNRESTSDALKALVQAMYGYYTVASSYVGEDVSVDERFHVASATEGVAYNESLGTISYDGTQDTTELFFAADDAGSYARNWELTGTVTRENVESMILSFGVKDKEGNTQWFSIKEHAAGLDNEGNNTIYDDVHAWWNYPSCAFYWRYDDAMTINYKITVVEDVLCAYFGKVGEEVQQAWYFPLTDSQFGGFAVDSEYQLGIFTRVACGMEMTNVAVTTDNRADNFQVASSTAGITYNKTEGTISYDGSQNTTELFFGAKDNDGYARNWELTGTVTRENVESMILSFGVKDKAGKTQWFSIKEHAAGLDNEGNNTIYDKVHAKWNEPACGFYWRYDNFMTINYKITVIDDVLCAYFGTDSTGLMQAWYFPLTEDQFGGFAVDSEYQLGIFTRVACGMEMTAVATTTDNRADNFHVISNTAGVSYDKTAGTVTYDGSQDTTEIFFGATDNNGYARNWELSGHIDKTWTEGMLLSFGVKDATGKTQWFSIKEHAAGLDNEGNNAIYNDTNAWWNEPACNFYWNNALVLEYKITVQDDVLRAYFGTDSSNLQQAWSFPLTDSQFGGFTMDSEYQLGIFTRVACAMNMSNVKATTDNTPDAFYLQSSVGGITADTVGGNITSDGSGNTEIYLKASPSAAYATNWEMTGTLKKTDSVDETLFVSFGLFDATGREQWFTILGNSLSKQWYWNWWDTEYAPDGTYVFPNAAALSFFDRGTDTLSYKLVIENDVLKMYFGADSSDLKLAWNLPLTNGQFGSFIPGEPYRIGIRTVDPCAFAISDMKVTTDGLQSNPDKILRRNEIQIRDPYILVDNNTYYMYGTQNFGYFNVYSSTNLEYWKINDPCFTGSEEFWGNASGSSEVEGAEAAYWAPEVHKYNDAYYMLATFTQDTDTMNQQASVILKSDSPVGPFEVWSDGPITPAGHSCLDATLYVENGTPYLVYAHEWQCSCRNYNGTGTIDYIQLSADLKTTVGNSSEWFGADDLTSFWEELLGTDASKTTDGPFVYTDTNGQKYLLWATHLDVDGTKTYAQVATKISSIGSKVSLKADTIKLYTNDGGHGMIFTDLDGVETLVLHAPNTAPSYAELFNVVTSSDGISLTQRDGTVVDGSGEIAGDPVFYIASKSDAILPNAYEGELYFSNSGNNEIYFAADDDGGYARDWEISGQIDKEWTEGLLLSFGVRDIYGNTQWFSIKEHAAGLDKEATTTIYDDVHAWWNEPSCNFYWNNALVLSYKITVHDDVLCAYFGTDSSNLNQAWYFPLTDSRFGDFAMDTEYQVGIYSTPGNMTFTDVSVTAENKPFNYYVSSISDGIYAGKTANTITYPGTHDTTEIFFAADENGGYSDTWEFTGTVNRDNVESMILSFGVKDSSGKTQWFSIKEHAAGLDNEGNSTIYDDVHAWWNQPMCGFYWRTDGFMTINYKITVKNDVLCAYFGTDSTGLMHAWYFPLTDSQFGGFAAGSEYQLGMFTRVACGLRFTNVAVTAKNVEKVPEQNWEDDGALKILAIGNSFSDDSMAYIYQIANDLGVEQIKLGNLFIGGCSLDTHYNNIRSNNAAYTYYVNENGNWVTNNDYTIKAALESENWDFVTLQQVSGYSGDEASYIRLQGLIGEVEELCPAAKLVWHMTWAYQGDSDHADFAKYNNDQNTMYQAIVSVVQNKIVLNNDLVTVIPSGTAIQNARTSYLGDNLTRDGYHLSLNEGRYIAGITWVGALTGLDVSNLTYRPNGVSEEVMAIAVESAKNALSNPYSVTNSAYSLDECYIELDLALKTGYYNSPYDSAGTDPYLNAWADWAPYYATKVFTKAELPVGTIISYTGDFDYRPEGWINGAPGSRPGTVSTQYVMIDEAWWGNWTERAFNIKVASTSVTVDEVKAVFKIYVPKSAYEQVEITLNKGYYHAAQTTSTQIYTGMNYLCTQTFNKDTLPIGSIIINNTGYTIRHEGWYDGSSKNTDGARGNNYAAVQVVVDSSWWGSWTVRGFNIPVPSLEDAEIANVQAKFFIYIPKTEKETDILKNKYVSILGDSISTYEGISNVGTTNTTIEGYSVWYNGDWKDVLSSSDETYWGQVMSKYGMNLLVNNSCGGNRLFDTSGSGVTAPAGYVRVENLAANTGELNGTKPDMIFIHMGTNDYIANITLGELTEDTYSSVVAGSGYKAPATFTEAYIITLEKALALYPDAQIFVFTLIPSHYNTNWDVLNSYNARIRELAAHYEGVVLVDVAAKSGINTSNYTTYTHDGTHPNNAGIAKIAKVLEEAILNNL